MVFPFRTKYNGKYYNAGEEIPVEKKTEKVVETKVETKVETPFEKTEEKPFEKKVAVRKNKNKE